MCAVSSIETRELGTLRCSLRFCWQRESFLSEWSWQEKRKWALLESNPPGVSCRRLIPMSAGELACVPSPRSVVAGLAATPPGMFGFDLIGIDLLMPSKTQGRG